MSKYIPFFYHFPDQTNSCVICSDDINGELGWDLIKCQDWAITRASNMCTYYFPEKTNHVVECVQSLKELIEPYHIYLMPLEEFQKTEIYDHFLQNLELSNIIAQKEAVQLKIENILNKQYESIEYKGKLYSGSKEAQNKLTSQIVIAQCYNDKTIEWSLLNGQIVSLSISEAQNLLRAFRERGAVLYKETEPLKAELCKYNNTLNN